MVRPAITTTVIATTRMVMPGVVAVLAIVIVIADVAVIVAAVAVGLICGGHLNNLSSMILHHLVSRGLRRIIRWPR